MSITATPPNPDAQLFQQWWEFVEARSPLLEDLTGAPMGSPDGAGLQSFGFTFPMYAAAKHWTGYLQSTWEQFLAEKPGEFHNLAYHFYWRRLNLTKLLPGTILSVADWVFTDFEAPFAIQAHLGFQDTDVNGYLGPQTLDRLAALGSTGAHDLWSWRVAFYDALGFRTKWASLYTRALELRDMAIRANNGPASGPSR